MSASDHIIFSLILVLLGGCASDLCLRMWDGANFRCMDEREICANYPARCKLPGEVKESKYAAEEGKE